MNFKRQAYQNLEAWKNSKNRKPLILRGARQVGKTTLVNQLGKSYKHFVSLNLERQSDLQYFTRFTDARTLLEALFTSLNISSSHRNQTLLFIDEIQESPEAIAQLRYFYEDIPELHVIAAGSLLEHVMHRVKNFPVGRVEYLYIHPLNFIEFLEAKKHAGALKQLEKIPVNNIGHFVLQELFHEYVIVGGMPEVVKTYLQTQSITALPKVYESIWTTYKEDVEKYANNSTDARVIKHIMDTAPSHLDKRIKFQNFGNSNYRSREVGEAMRNLNDARIIQLIYPTTSAEPPIAPDLKKAPRLQFLDTGLLNYELNIQADMLGLPDLANTYKGSIIPHIISQELISLQTLKYKHHNFWVREKAQSSAEVDLVITFKDMVIPVEVKSGKIGKLKSLHEFVEQAPHPYAIRMYGGEFSVEEHETPRSRKPYLLMNLPYYVGTKLPEYIAYFVNNY